MSQRRLAGGQPKPLTKERAWNYLLYILARRSYTVAELREKLLRRGLPAAEAEPLLQRLHELRLVDDSTFAEQYVSSRKRARGRLVLRRELQRKGVAEELVERELEALSPEQQARAATELLQKNAWRYRPQSDQTQAGQEASEAASHARREQLLKARSKAFAFLARRGYTAEAAQQALQRTGWFEDHDD